MMSLLGQETNWNYENLLDKKCDTSKRMPMEDQIEDNSMSLPERYYHSSKNNCKIKINCNSFF